jgi:predicted kinase
MSRLIIVTGLPATGKTTFARRLATALHVPLFTKDAIKEPLIECLGAADAAQSRKLSDASFAVLFALTRELEAAGMDAVLEGNFRPGEHEHALGSSSVRIAQILCELTESERLARLGARAADSTRHPGHRDADLARHRPPAGGNAFLELPGERFRCDGGASNPDHQAALLARIDRWWHAELNPITVCAKNSDSM